MRSSISVSTILCLSLIGCTPAHIVRLSAPPESERAEVLVHRESAFNHGGVGLVFGADKRDFVQLNNGEYARLYLPSGNHSFFVRSTQADKPYELSASLLANQTTCFKASANPENFAKALLPFTFHLSNSFLLERVSCLSEAEIAKYSSVKVEYEKN
ncbi:MAG: hypothetical protein IH605_07105 [Burkholderiales bacterium]|nr:hypothetical protein [Burkholderiales bacterium]